MRQQLRAGAIALALLGSISIAAAQSGSAGAGADAKLSLTASQEQKISQALKSEPAQSAPSGFQAEVGSKLSGSLNAKALPSNVQAQVPEAKNYQFVKLSDRLLLVDPQSQQIAAIIMGAGTTGSGAAGSSSGASGGASGSGSGGGSSGGSGSSPGGSRY